MLALTIVLAAAPLSVAAPGLRCAGIEAAVCDAYLEHFSTELARVGSGRIAVRTRNDLSQVLGVERQQQLLGCDTGSCLAELAGGLGVDAVLSGAITRTEDSFIATLRVLRARDGSELATASRRFSSSSAMEAWLDDQAAAIADRLAAPPPASGAGRARVALLAIGAALVVASVIAFVISKFDAAALMGNLPVEQIPSVAARGRLLQPLGLAFGGVGLACVAAGLIWLALGSDAPAATVSPMPGGGALLSVGGSFW